jgi:TolA-binding protein
MPATAPPPTHSATVGAQVLWIKYQREIVAAILLAIIAAIGYAGYRFYSDRKDANAATLLAKAKTPAEYEQVIAQYSRSPAGASAYVLLGQAQRNDKKFLESNTTLQNFVQKFPKHELAPAARIAMAANFESLGRNDDALSIYQKVANDTPQSYEAAYALISQVRLLKAKNQNEQARQICEKILTDHSESRWAGEAMRELRELTPKEAAAPPPGAPDVGARSTSAPPPMLARPPAAPAPSAPAKPK